MAFTSKGPPIRADHKSSPNSTDISDCSSLSDRFKAKLYLAEKAIAQQVCEDRPPTIDQMRLCLRLLYGHLRVAARLRESTELDRQLRTCFTEVWTHVSEYFQENVQPIQANDRNAGRSEFPVDDRFGQFLLPWNERDRARQEHEQRVWDQFAGRPNALAVRIVALFNELVVDFDRWLTASPVMYIHFNARMEQFVESFKKTEIFKEFRARVHTPPESPNNNPTQEGEGSPREGSPREGSPKEGSSQASPDSQTKEI